MMTPGGSFFYPGPRRRNLALRGTGGACQDCGVLVKFRSGMRIRGAAVLLLLAAMSAGCNSSRPPASEASSAPGSAAATYPTAQAPASSPTPGIRRHPHLMIIVDENHSQ